MPTRTLLVILMTATLAAGCIRGNNKRPAPAPAPLPSAQAAPPARSGAESAAFEIVNREKVDPSCGAAPPNCTRIGVVYPRFTAAGSPAAVAALNGAVDSAIRTSMQRGDNVVGSIDQGMDLFISEYRKFGNEDPFSNMPWENQTTVKVERNSGGIVCLSFNYYEYSGGVHPNSRIVYMNFFLADGRQITLYDLLAGPDKMAAITAVGERKFRQMRGLAPAEDLAEAGYWFDNDRFHLSDSFAVRADSLLFVYNPYEVASYADGFIEIEMPYAEISGLLKKPAF